MNTPLEPTSARLSGVDPFAARAGEKPEEPIEAVWFDQPPSSRRISLRPPAAPPQPIGDQDADTWFR